ncbi:unnamed protein product [Miscanthus lutarioriparius]|uniref:Uncharacterized protein n=1 Tax=Miscanthus lutarioriparius TaxID=422564 RepID=A0A811S1M1_9POAL|nr:unnamed protein product [Miscanthus lutarioriparius]
MRTCNYISAAVASPPPLIRQWPGRISWRRPSRLQCSATRTRHEDGPDNKGDNRLKQNTGIFHPSIWGDTFLGYSNPAASSQQQMTEREDKLKEEVAEMIASSSTTTAASRLQLIDALERLCLDHLFEEEISAALAQIETADVSGYDPGTVHCGFVYFGNIDTRSRQHMRTHGEVILEEAVLFSQTRLERMIPYMEESSLAREVKSSLEIPLPRRVRIYESKYYISANEKDATLHETVLQLAKLNSNIMQLHHRQELDIITRWWKDIDIESRLPFARDRIVECYLWILGVYYEPCYSRARIILTMNIAIATIVDDIFDSYATPEECELFTKCMESWDSKGARDLPECMKFALEKIFNSYETIENMLRQEGKYRMPYLRYFAKDIVRSYNKEVKMLQEGYIPKSVEEHLKVSMMTSGCPFLSCASLVGMHDIATEECFDWVSSVPKMVQALSVILRLEDDLESDEREWLIPHVASTIDSYMKEHDVSIEVARGQIHVLKEESWKDFNSEWLNTDNNAYPKQILERIFNLTRTMEFMYNQGENFTNCHNLKDTVHSLLLAEPFAIPI